MNEDPMYELATDYFKETDMTDNELEFFDPETGNLLPRVPEGATIPEHMPYGIVEHGKHWWYPQGPPWGWLQEDNVPRFTREPLALPKPPLPTEAGLYCDTEADLHALLDGLTDGEHIKTAWAHNEYLTTTEGPVRIEGLEVFFREFIRSDDGSIVSRALTSIEVSRDEEVTATRDDEEALHALLDSLEKGQEVTAEWRDKSGTMILTGKAWTSGPRREVDGYIYSGMRSRNGVLNSALRSVTVRRTVVKRWERVGDE